MKTNCSLRLSNGEQVPGGWIYTHTVIRFGSVDKNFAADTFVPDSKDWSGDGAVIRNT
jgi:hypothetical protein